MTEANQAAAFRAYIRTVERTRASGRATEHSYRPALQALIEGLGAEGLGAGVGAINEPARVACGAPDFIVERGGVPLGHVECKDIGIDLNRVEAGAQLRRYRDGLPNLILTDHLEFRRYAEGARREAVRLGRLDSRGKLVMEKDGADRLAALFEAFFAADAPTVADARDLARRMAAKARLLRDGIARILRQEDRTGPLRDLLRAYREVLIAGLSRGQFADLQAQTAAYGLFAARCLHDPEAGPFTRQSAAFADTTPLLRDLFGRVAGPGIDPRVAWIVADLALLLARADMASILADFGRRSRQEDPVVHFYEDFLAAYDPALREMRGVYYTPEPVVRYIVASVDRLLRARFALPDGLADTATVAGPDGAARTQPRVLILDPAAGTGTFLREAVARIRSTIEAKGLAGAWGDYVRAHLLPRLFGFELLMAPYAICHLKLALEIGGTNAGFTLPAGQRLGVFLTNALEEAHESTAGALFAHEIARESAGADAMKRDAPVMVVLGNPPYSGHSANKGPWIAGLLRGRDGADETGSYFRVDGAPLGEKNPKWLNDDYVKFIRFAQWRIARTGEGVLGFVTNHSWLDNPTFRGMRKSLMESFDEIHLLDLHGNAKKKERAPDGTKDENVFDIQQGVAIGLFMKRADGGGGGGPARVFHADLWGAREVGPDGGKYGWLSANDVATTAWTELAPKPPLYLFVPRDEALWDEYKAGAKLTDIFPVHSVGVVTARDRLAIQWSAGDMRRVAADFASRDAESARNAFSLGRDSSDWKIADAQRDVRDHPDPERHVAPVLYRPFDTRFTWYTGRAGGFICRPRPKVMRHMLAGPNLGLSTTRSTEIAGGWEHVFVSRTLTQHHTVSLKEVNYLFPLYLYPTEGAEGFGKAREANLAPGFVEACAAALGLAFLPDGAGDLEATFGPEDVFGYIYAVLHSPEYRRRYAPFLKSDFPRVPLTGRAPFAALARLGRRLTALHMMEAEGDDAPAFPTAGSNRVEKVRYAPPKGAVPEGAAPGRVWINGAQSFEGVAPETWGFSIGGYRPAEKWLKDRKGRALGFADVAHYRRLCAALAETPRLMARIDETIAAHGGWPLGR